MNASTLIQTLDSVKALLENNLRADQPVTSPITAGDTRIQLEHVCPFEDGNYIVVYDPDSDSEAYHRQLIVEDETTLWLSEPIPVDLETARIRKTIDGLSLNSILIGTPNTLSEFPCITISGETGAFEPLASGGLYDAIHELTISIWTECPTYDGANRNAWAIAREVEAVLGNQRNPTESNCSVWFAELHAAQQDELINANSTLKVIHFPYSVHETVQRFTWDIPVHLKIAQDGYL